MEKTDRWSLEVDMDANSRHGAQPQNGKTPFPLLEQAV
jgi:hypothetical protein